jgi:hypothetical protein
VCLYIDSHRKSVYSGRLIPCGLIGRTGKVLGCRTLVLLHDAAGTHSWFSPRVAIST